jgi:hypothetical protein
MSKKEIKDQITKLTLELFQTEHAWESDADYIKYRDLAYKAKAKNLKANESKLDALYIQIHQLEETYKLFSVKKEYKLSDTLEEFVNKCMRGVDYGPKGLVPIASWDNRFVLLKKPGHNAWCGIGDSKYYPTEYSLHDITKVNDNLGRIFEASIIFEEEGLNTKKAIEKSEKYINTLKGK